LEAVKRAIDVIQGEDWMIINSDNIRTKKSFAKGRESEALSRKVNATHIGAKELTAAMEGEAKRVIVRWLKWKMKSLDIKEGRLVDIQINLSGCKINGFTNGLSGGQVVRAVSTQEANIRGNIGVFFPSEAFIKRDVLSFLDVFGS
jgi:hypothetical protein